MTETDMMAEVRGTAVKLVIMKYFGKVRKCIQTNGAVNIWHETVMTVLSQSFFIGLNTLILASSGYHADIVG